MELPEFGDNTDLEDIDLNVIRYKPMAIDDLSRKTKFSKKELKIMYRGFKQDCPTGIVNEEAFKQIYAQFFPQGDSNSYAHYIFSSFDREKTGSLTFEQFVESLAILCHGTREEKLLWAFSLYDANQDGVISRVEMTTIVTAIYDLLGRNTVSLGEYRSPKDHADSVFKKLDLNGDGLIDINEFMTVCQQDDTILMSVDALNTVLCID